ncbi:hypothetical protein Cflav_PD0549 [Pedosphaera parvula Ellin514]|uniref:Uncharacterized protein n=1 Tax=Pedosphaera parvula (strain Ellin514) TaxID=320771 RepID=B9XRS7_PEDPL|nr:hypothetical protein Cflav_PD0549 [Pedosphaera parvula Ellin514]
MRVGKRELHLDRGIIMMLRVFTLGPHNSYLQPQKSSVIPPIY